MARSFPRLQLPAFCVAAKAALWSAGSGSQQAAGNEKAPQESRGVLMHGMRVRWGNWGGLSRERTRL